MYLRFLSLVSVVILFILSAHVYGQANNKAGYNFKPSQTNYYGAGPNARDLTACKAGDPGKAVLPGNAAVGERLCDTEATRLGIPVAHMKWVASPKYGTWGTPKDNFLCKVVNGSLKYVKNSGSDWTNVVICKYEPFDCGDKWSYTLDAGVGGNVNNWQLDWTKTNNAKDSARVGGVDFKCMPQKCTAAICQGTPSNAVDECFLTSTPGVYKKLNGTVCPLCPAGQTRVGNQCVNNCTNGGTPPTCTSPTVPAVPECRDGIDNDADGKIDFVCSAQSGTTAAPVSKGRESASFTAAQGVFEEIAPNGQARRPSIISNRVNPGDIVKIVSVSNNKFSISVGKGNRFERKCDYGSLSFVNSNDRTIQSPQLRNIPNSGITVPAGTQKAFVSFDDNPQEYSDNSGYNGSNGYNPCQVTIEVFSPAVNVAGSTCVSDPDCTSADDNSEAPVTTTQCSDGIDNDGDGMIDFIAPITTPITLPDPDCTSATDDTEGGDLVCAAGTTKTPTPGSPVCLLVATPKTTPAAGTSFSLTAYSHLTGACTLASATTHNTPTTPITSSAPSTTLSVSPSSTLTVNATTIGTFTTAPQAATLLTCPAGTPTCSIGAGGVISCGCYTTGVTPPTLVVPPSYSCVSNLCAEGQYFCSAENICKPAGESCSAFTCNKNDTCEVGESCNCSDCTSGALDNTKDKCGIAGGQQLYCTKDSVVSTNTRFPFCLPACLDGQACTTTCTQQVGACCPAGKQWNSTENKCIETTCGEGKYYCAAQKKCLAGGTACEPGTPVTCVNDGVCSGDESCQCGDCVDGPTQTDPAKKADDKDKCSIIGGLQAVCSDDLPADGKPGACCVAPKTWDTATATCQSCSNTQAPTELKANYDQPYITCTGNGIVSDTHFRYRITKTGSTDAPFISELHTIGTQVLHPKMATGKYTVNCFYGTTTAVDTSATAVPHECMKTMEAKEVNANAVNGCSRIFAYKEDTLSDEMSSNSAFDATFRCGSRLDTGIASQPFSLRVGSNNVTLGYDVITQLFVEYGLGISDVSDSYSFTTGSTPVACAVRVGEGYSTNDYCQLTACVGDNCNVPQAFSVVHSGDKLCTTAEKDSYNIGCNPDAPDDVRNQCVTMFQNAINARSTTVTDGIAFKVSFIFEGTTPTEVECVKYAAGKMPEGLNLQDNVVCSALLRNGEVYQVFAADTGGGPINSLQTTARTAERDTEVPTLESPIKYYTDSSRTTEVDATKWYNTPVVAVALCRDTPSNESTACSCAPSVHPTTTNASEWSLGVPYGTVNIGADFLRYTRTISATVSSTEKVTIVDTAGNISTPQNIAVSLDTESPKMTVSESGTGVTRDIVLTASDSGSKIWKNTSSAPTGGTNTSGIVYRTGLIADLTSLTFDADCSISPNPARDLANVVESATLPPTATVTIPGINTTTHVVSYCVRDNAGNTTRGVYPVITDACFSATNMATIPTLDTYRGLTSTRLSGTGTPQQKFGYSFSANTTDASCFRGILATNITTLVANQYSPRTTTTLSNWDTDRAPLKSNATTLNTNGYYYYKYTTPSTSLTITPPTSGSVGNKSVIVDGGDIKITNDIIYEGNGNTLVLIAKKNANGAGGNIIIDSGVNRIDAILIADGGALKSIDSTTPGERLTINGRIYSYNTRGGSLLASGTDIIEATAPQIFSANGTLGSATLPIAQTQDLERLRPMFTDGDNTCSLRLNYYAYTTATLPALLQKPAGYAGGTCGF